MAYKHVIRAKTKNLLNITPSMCKRCTYKDGILKANVVNFYYAVLNVTDLFEIGNTYTVSWSIIHKKSLSQTASVVVYGKSKTDPDKTVFANTEVLLLATTILLPSTMKIFLLYHL